MRTSYNLINLHAHSEWSDGHYSVMQNALACKALGFSACVLTEHVYSSDDNFSLNIESLAAEREEVKKVSAELNYPIILGVEMSIKGYEEVCIFGSEAIDSVMQARKKYGRVAISDLAFTRSRFNCCMNLCHPMDAPRFITHGGHLVIDAYEFVHCGSYEFGTRAGRTDYYGPRGLVKLANSDAHSIGVLPMCYNATYGDPITTEEQLIDYIRSRNMVVHVINEPGTLAYDEMFDAIVKAVKGFQKKIRIQGAVKSIPVSSITLQEEINQLVRIAPEHRWIPV